MSRISSVVRPRNATAGPSAVLAAAVGQQSQTRDATSMSLLTGIEVAARSVMSPLPPDVWRPSSHTRPRPLAVVKNDAKPCCVLVPSLCGLAGADQVLPPSRDVEVFRSYASGSGPFISIQCATSDPSASARTEGTSAKLVMRCSLATTTTGADHPAG